MSAPALQEASLTWGTLGFVAPGESEEPFDIEAIAGTNFGNPVPVIEVVRSLLIDGAQAATTRWDNREVVIRVRISANDGEALAQAEAELFGQALLAQPPPLVWTSPLGLSATSVFDVVVADLRRDNETGWDLEEVLYGDRFYELTLICLPFARAVESTVVPALPVPTDPEAPVWVDINTCGSITDWSLETSVELPDGPFAGSSGGETFVRGGGSYIDSDTEYVRLVLTDAIVVPVDHYLAVDIRIDMDSGDVVQGQWRAHWDGVWRAPVAIVPGIGEDGSTRVFFNNVGSISSIKFAFDFTLVPPGSATGAFLEVFNVARTDTIGSSTDTTQRQQSRLVEVTGSAPTQAALRLYDATPADLAASAGTAGDILVYTTRSDVPPNLRRWLSDSEPAAADADRVSGSVHTLATDTVFRLPASLLRSGTYALLALMDVNSPGTLSWQARMTTLGGAALVGSSVVVSGELDLAVTSGYQVLDLAALILPVVEVQGTGYYIELTLSGTVNMLLDEAWLFSLDDGVLTWVRDDEGLDWIEMRSPELGAARPSVWGGRNLVGTGGSCIDWKCLSFGPHRFDPGTMQIFTVCTKSLESQCEIEFFPRFHSNVRGEETG